ncbi:MAG: sigma-70 family RNA polymerase sigma factor [bacterium]|nr:sigma-70 family RNA polymerase sigma factor [bacterium]
MPIPSETELLQHRAFVRGLAQHLLGDAEVAEDVAQDALLTAIERPPRDGSRLKSWLGTVTRRLAFRHLRDRDRRRRKLDSMSAPGTPEPPDSIAGRRAVLGQVTAAVQGLDDVYLEVVLLRYFEGLTPSEIAQRLDAPLATVSSRLQRALVKLRGRLDDAAGARWRASLAAVVGLPPSLGKVSTASPNAKLLWSLTMTQASAATAVATAAIALACVGYLFFSSFSVDAPQADAAGPVADVSESRQATGSSDAASAGSLVRDSVTADAAPGPVRIRLVATLQWQDGSPARAGKAILRGVGGATTEPVVVSEDRTVVEFSNVLPGRYDLRIAGSSLEHPVQLATGPVERRTIELLPVTEFRGRVRTIAGVPIAGAWVVGDGGQVLAVSNGLGAFRVRSLGRFNTFACRAQGYEASDYRPCPASGEEADVVLSPGGAMLEGWVEDPDGEPVAFTTVMIGQPFSGDYVVTAAAKRVDQSDRVRVQTNADGYFFAVGLRPGQVPLRVPRNGHVWSDWNQRLELAAGATEVVRIRLQRPCSITGVVSDRTGAPVARADVEVRWGKEIDQWDRTYADEDGRFRLQGLPPGPVVLTAKARSNGRCRERILLQPGRDAEWRPFLHRGTVGRIVDAQGQPVGGVNVLAEGSSFKASVVADQDGEFAIGDCPDSLTSLYVIAGQERVLGHWSNVDVHQDGLFLRLAPNAGLPCTITVRVLGPDGRPAEDARLSLGEPGEPARIGSGPPDDEGWIRLSGPIYGVRFEAKIRSELLGRVSLGVRAPNADGLIDFGTVRMQQPGRLALEVRPEKLRAEVERFVIETLDGVAIVGGTGVPVSGLRLAPGDYRVRLIGGELSPTAIEVSIERGEVTSETVELTASAQGGRGR